MATFDLLLVGRTGNGKSSTGNSILGKKAFTPKSSSSAVVADVILSDSSEIDGNNVTVVDGPGLGDSGLDDVRGVEGAIVMSRKALSFFTVGFNALLIVLKYGVRFTKQEKDAIQIIKSIFGEDVVKSHGVIIMTHGESFDLDMEDEVQTFDDWCKQQGGDVQALFRECSYRCVLFSNKTQDAGKMKEQNDILMSKVVNNQASRSRYTMEDFKRAEPSRSKLIIVSKLPQLRKDTDKIVDRVDRAVSQSEDLPARERTLELERLRDELAEYRKELQTLDQGTGALKQLFVQLSVTETSIKTKIEICKREIDQQIYQEERRRGYQEQRPPLHQDSLTSRQDHNKATTKMRMFIIVGLIVLVILCVVLYFACHMTCVYVGFGISVFAIVGFCVYFYRCRDRMSAGESTPAFGRMPTENTPSFGIYNNPS